MNDETKPEITVPVPEGQTPKEGSGVTTHHCGRGGRQTRHILRHILSEVRAIRRQGDGSSLPRRNGKLDRAVLSAEDAAFALRIELQDLVELGEEARKILANERRDRISERRRDREGRTGRMFHVRRDHEDR